MAQIIDHNLRALHLSSRAELESIQQKLDCRPRARNQENALWRRADTSCGEPAIPNPKLFQTLESLHIDADVNALPEPCECAVHLELLEVFHTLRVYILSSKELDTTFGIFLRKRTVYRQTRRNIRVPVTLRDDTIQERRAQKWPYYLNIAATRFKIWAKQIDNEISARSDTERGIVLKYLPPLDVLVIWHAYLLNPQDFADYCRENRLNYLNRVPFPWSQIHDAIHPKDLAYSLPQESSEWLRTSAKLEPDLLQYLIEAGKTVNSATPILSRFGKRTSTLDSPPVLSLGELFGMNDTTSRELSFLKVLQASEAQKAHNRCLVDNVQRQAAFVDKMHARLWIRSPAVEGTLRRAVDRYDKFLQLFKLYPNKMLVPTLDIDLVWHTHQLSATRYTSAMLQRAGRFINHDDKLGKGPLDEAMSQTKDLFRVRFGLEYSVCLCWDCEAAASALELSEHGEMFEESCIDALVDRVQQDVSYYRAVELARRMKQPLPIRPA